MFCFRQQLFYSTELNSTSETKSCYGRVAVELQSSQLSTAVARRLKQALECLSGDTLDSLISVFNAFRRKLSLRVPVVSTKNMHAQQEPN